jgi:cysteine desulfuration protein SufE
VPVRYGSPRTSPANLAHAHILADSDAHIVRGLIAILFALSTGKSVTDIRALDPNPIFAELGLNEHLTPQRSNGLASMVARIRSDAAGAIAQHAAAR